MSDRVTSIPPVGNQPPSGGRPARRTQKERSEQTRAKLIDATIQTLLDVGYAELTTRRVSDLAGVSHGAQVHHYRYRADLVGAAIEELGRRRITEFRKRAARIPADATNRAELLLELVSTDFQSTAFTVFVKVWVAAADDPELHARLVPVERQLARDIGEIVSELTRELPEVPNLQRRLRVALETMRGLALRQTFEPRARRARDPWPEIRETLLELMLAPSAAGTGRGG